ncbi:MAG: stage III sporulation protein AF [Dorea sp.]|jgi:stage III sporulation protein AF|uniref:stage III sporulation protein AF n=1 Tax=Sporofaciens sp. JLR.KK001 TaxID=3112621 RepID=UPI002171DD85|nr:stage III sporulation protein AF [Dorea sp.]
MFEYLYEWMQNIAFYMIMVTFIMHVIPNSDYKRYIRFFTGLVLAVMLAAPVLKLFGMGDVWQNLYGNETYQEQVKKLEDASKDFLGADHESGNARQEEVSGKRIFIEEIEVD